MYWTITSFPELYHLSETDRRELLRRYGARRAMLWIGIRSLVFGLYAAIISAGVVAAAGLRPIVAFLLVFPIWVVLIYQMQIIWIRGHMRIYLEETARSQKLPLCLNCGYSTQGLTRERCPECGAPLDAARRDPNFQ